MLCRFILALILIPVCQELNAQSFKIKLTDHSANIETVSISPDGKLMASGGWDGNINLYSFDSMGNPVFKTSYKGHLGAVISLSFSANNKYLVSGSKDYSSRIWNIDTPSKHKVFNLHLEPVTASFLDPSYKFLISASLDGTIRTTNVNDVLKSKVIKPGGPINDLQLSRDRKHYYIAIKGGIIKKLETAGSNNEIMVYKGHTDEINAIELSPDGNFIASASSDKTIQIWDINSGKSIKTLNGFEWKVTSLKYTVDGKYIIGGCNNGISKLYEVETGKNISDFNQFGKNVRDVAFSKDGKQIFIATLMESDKFGAVVYNSGITSNAAPVQANGNGSKTKAKPSAVNNKKPNGSK